MLGDHGLSCTMKVTTLLLSIPELVSGQKFRDRTVSSNNQDIHPTTLNLSIYFKTNSGIHFISAHCYFLGIMSWKNRFIYYTILIINLMKVEHLAFIGTRKVGKFKPPSILHWALVLCCDLNLNPINCPLSILRSKVYFYSLYSLSDEFSFPFCELTLWLYQLPF